MSADLFAEFANDAPPSQPRNASTGFSETNQTALKGPFDFGLSSNDASAATASPIESWPSFPVSQNAAGGLNVRPAITHQVPIPDALNNDDDGWGDFETAEQEVIAPPKAVDVSPDAFGGFHSHSKPQEVRNRPVRAPTLDIMTNTLVDVGSKPVPRITHQVDSSWDLPRTQAKSRMGNPPQDPSILFDADDFELQGPGTDDGNDDEEEFGDFETVAPISSTKTKAAPASTTAVQTAPLLDLLSLDDTPPQPSRPKNEKKAQVQTPGPLTFGITTSRVSSPPKSPSFQERNPFPDLTIQTPTRENDRRQRPRSPSPVTAWPKVDSKAKSPNSIKDDDNWGAWDDVSSGDIIAKEDIDSTKPPTTWDWGAGEESESAAIRASDNDPPPINVPPPSVLLSIFPELFNASSAFFKPIAGQNTSIKNQVLSNPKAVQFLQGYLLLATTAARVIAGRKHRWHRDKILAKSMSISAAGSKGMKLAGVDKTQSAREDREALDVAATWREHVGRLRSAVAAANTAGKTHLKIPELSENMHVQTAKAVPTAPKPCIICGLKREERVAKVDYEVEDSFGEWWVDYWGHRACKNFWIEHEQKLRQR